MYFYYDSLSFLVCIMKASLHFNFTSKVPNMPGYEVYIWTTFLRPK